MPVPLFLIMLALGLSPAPPQYQLKYTEAKDGAGIPTSISLYERGNRKWSRPIFWDDAVLLPRQRLVLYTDQESLYLIARRFNGKQAWEAEADHGMIWPVAGGNVLLCGLFEGVGPAFQFDKVTDWPDAYDEPIAAYNVKTASDFGSRTCAPLGIRFGRMVQCSSPSGWI